MAVFQARCRNCGQQFPVNNVFGGSGGIAIQGITYGPCPFCGGVGDLQDGVYNLENDVASLISEPGQTLETFLALSRVIENSRANREAPTETVKKIEEISPTAARIARLLPHPNIPAYLSLLVAIAALVVQLQQPPPLTAEGAAILLQQARAELVRQSPHEAAALQQAFTTPVQSNAEAAQGRQDPRSTNAERSRAAQAPNPFPKSMEKLTALNAKRYGAVGGVGRNQAKAPRTAQKKR